MKKLAVAVAILFAAGLIMAHASEAQKAGKTHELTVEVVAADLKANTITIKDDKGENKTVPVLGKAIAELKNVKAGEKVTLICQDNETGGHEGVVGIKKS